MNIWEWVVLFLLEMFFNSKVKYPPRSHNSFFYRLNAKLTAYSIKDMRDVLKFLSNDVMKQEPNGIKWG